MKTTQSTVIASLVKTSQGANVKVVSDKPSLSGNEILDLVMDSGKQVLAYKQAGDTMSSCLESLNKHIACLHNGGVRLQDGRSKDKQTLVIKTALMDSLGTLSKSYKQDIWEMFFKAVNSGKALKGLNKSRNKSDKVKKEKDAPAFADVLAKVYNHADFDSLSLSTQDEIKDLLLEAGYELPEA
jgi:hypothetical protein